MTSQPRHDLAAAYDGLEAAFADADALERYRVSMLERTTAQADFLAPRLAGGDALEIGSGNGRLLIELARRGAIRTGLGIDVARSRIEFARAWAADLGLSAVRFDVADALTHDLGRARFDAALCITGAFGYFEPLQEGAGAALAHRFAAALRPGGLLCLELYPHPEYVRLLEHASAELQLWRELPPDDPWRFYLSRLLLNRATGVLTHEKTFVHRHTGEVDSGRVERLRLYSPEEIRTVVEAAGFEDVVLYDDWSERPYAGGEIQVLTAARAQGRPD